jgi:hypothetical protein
MTRTAVVLVVLAGCAGPKPAAQAPTAADSAAAPAPAPAAGPQGAAAPAQPRRPPLPDTAAPVQYQRELFRYTGGARDPFESLIETNRVGPRIEDLQVVSISYDARYGNSVAIVRAAHEARQLRLRRGDTLGNMRVLQIRQYEVVFQIVEFGFERQQVLTLRRPEVSP